MNKKESFPKQEIDQERNFDSEKESLFIENQKIIDNNVILRQIKESFDEKWSSLNENQKNKAIQAFAEFIEKLKDYHDSYVNLKFAARRSGLQLENIEKYQAGIKNADEREHILHNAFIDATNILSRRMKEVGIDNSWRKDDKIYGLDHWSTRQKLRDWMFEIFEEKIA